ncbi:proteasome regulatory particle lid subunit [Martiniozyma asiatica (nom. inval.)]|nr:proteasome regulatory particle lid subunit [Martiniozyma asiatica]
MDDITGILHSLSSEIEANDAELASSFYQLEEYYDRKLYHQLSESLLNIFQNPNSAPIRLQLYDNFISLFAKKVNQLQYVEFLILALNGSGLTPNDSLQYLTQAKDNINNLFTISQEQDINDYELIQALLLVDLKLATVKLQCGFVDEASSIIDQSEKQLDELICSIESSVMAAFHYAKAQLMKTHGDFNAFYTNSILFLECVDNLDLLENKDLIIQDICIAGILGDKIYNFGQIINHPILSCLKLTWLKEFLVCLNTGNIETFELLSNHFNEISEISANVEFIKQKVCIMALIELIFNKPSNSKVISYKEIEDEISFISNSDEVEHLIMKCLSLNLLKGVLNQVDEEVEISWIQPRTMTIEQISTMQKKLANWTEKTRDVHAYMAKAGEGLYV